MKVLGPTAHHVDPAQTEVTHDLLEKFGPAQQRLDQRDLEVGADQSQHQPGKSRS